MPKQPLSIFISYAHEDRNIAIAVSNMLQQTFGDSLSEVFIDTDGISIGGNIKSNIMAAIKRADTMIVVSTGVGRTSHEWTGWELGAFEASHTPEGDVRGRVITLCLRSTVPGTTQLMRYVPLEIEPALLELSETDFVEKLEVDDKDEFVKLLGQILFATEGDKLDERNDKLSIYKKKVKSLKAEIFSALKKMIRAVEKPQFQLLVRYDSTKIDRVCPDIPTDANVTEVGSSFSLFGITANDAARFTTQTDYSTRMPQGVVGTTLLWKDFRALVANHPLGQYWCTSLARVVVSANSNPTPDVDNSQVISSSNLVQPRRFRVILTTNTKFYNKEVEASLYLVEALQRRDYGDEATTMLLKGLHIVCRFRFMFLENKSAFSYFNVRTSVSPAQLPAIASQLIAELDSLHNEALQADLHKPGAWREYVSEEALVEMNSLWVPIELEIRNLCSESIKSGRNQEQQSECLGKLVTELKKINDDLRSHNNLLLGAMATKLKEFSGDATSVRGGSTNAVTAPKQP